MPHTFSCVSNRADLGLLLTSEEGGKREDEREREDKCEGRTWTEQGFELEREVEKGEPIKHRGQYERVPYATRGGERERGREK